MEMGNNPSRWTTENQKIVADCRIFRVENRHSRRVSDGKEADWFVINTADFVNVVGVTPKRELLLVRQFRHGSNEFSWELPGGMVDEGESPVDAGLRELLEETGYSGSSHEMIGRCHPNPAIMDNWCHFVLVENVEKTAATAWDENEEMEVCTMPLDEVWRMVSKGQVTHSLTLAALMHFSLL